MFDFILGALATWRLTSLLHRERGPANILLHFRHVVGVRYDEQSQPYATTNLAEGVLCFWCCSVWCATLCGVAFYLAGLYKTESAAYVLAYILALSAAAIAVERLLE